MNRRPESAAALVAESPDQAALAAESPAGIGATRASWRDWLELTKPEITFLVAISSLAGFVLGSTGAIEWARLAALMTGVISASAGGSALNHLLEWSLDARMRRTANRPIPAGRISPVASLRFGVALVAIGLGILCPLVNPLTGVLAALTVLLYLFVYTPLKRVTTWNTLVGTIPGALPALGGWTAATGSVDATGWAVFAVLVFWQVPHFFSLAWMYRQDYARAKYAMLPSVSPDGASTVAHVVIFSFLMAGASLYPYFAGAAGPLYLVAVLLAAAAWIRPVAAFVRTRSNPDARRVLMATIWYIPMWVAIIVIDRLLAL